MFLGDGKGNFGTGIKTPLDEYLNGLQVADLNGDGLPDLALSDGGCDSYGDSSCD